ncbi:MAG: ABC transporter ATP-binding protein [Nitrospinota bacterium]|nr:ABC transporter ATP-binding protein [Nitrospinota bacterium]
MTFPFIEIDSFSVEINGKSILRDISFSVEQGEYVSLIGPNGAGKTTLLKSIGRITDFGRGSISILGKKRDSRKQKEYAKIVSYVPQSDGRYLPFTVYEFVLMGRYPYLSSFSAVEKEDKEKVYEVLKQTGTEKFAARGINTLSGGERQKVFIAAALCQEAEIILLDEPTTFLDPKHHDEVHHTLSEVNRSGKTLIIVTHDLNMAISPPVTKVVALKEGKLTYIGEPGGLLSGSVLSSIYEKDFTIGRHPVTGMEVILP